MASSGLLSLKWNNHSRTFLQILSNLQNKSLYNDATIACEGKLYPVHKFVLSACSDYFEDIFRNVKEKHTVIILKDISCEIFSSLLKYMYIGEVSVEQSLLSKFISAAECLKIKGLAVPDEDALFEQSDKLLEHSREKKRLRSHDVHEGRSSNKHRKGFSYDISSSPSKSLSRSLNAKTSNDNFFYKDTKSVNCVDSNEDFKLLLNYEADDTAIVVKKEPQDADHCSSDEVPGVTTSPLVAASSGTVSSSTRSLLGACVTADAHVETSSRDFKEDTSQDCESYSQAEQQQKSVSEENVIFCEPAIDKLEDCNKDGIIPGRSNSSDVLDEAWVSPPASPDVVAIDSQQLHQGSNAGKLPFPSQSRRASTPGDNVYSRQQHADFSHQRSARAGSDLLTNDNYYNGDPSTASSINEQPNSINLEDSQQHFLYDRYSPPITCGKKSSTPYSERPYPCPYCPYRATVKCNLAMHVRKHTGEKPYSCNMCGFTTAFQQSLQRHIKTTHSCEGAGSGLRSGANYGGVGDSSNSRDVLSTDVVNEEFS